MKPPKDNDADAIEAEAMAWLAERDEGFAPGRALAFEAWLRRDARHAAMVAELEQVLAGLDDLAGRRDEVNAHFGRVSPPRSIAAEPATKPVPASRWWRTVAWGGVAAALAVGAVWFLRSAPPESRYATIAGGYEYARLADGSTLELNTASTARVRFTAAERHVALEAGEAYFQVAHDPARPFFVSVGGVVVQAIGTAFNIRLAPGEVAVTVTEGRIEMEREGPHAASGTANADPVSGGQRARPRSFTVGERVTVPTGVFSPVVERLAPGDIRAELGWQRRVTEFSDAPLAEVAARFNRHHSLQLIVADPALGARRIGGMFALDDVEAFVRLLERDGIVRAVREGDTVRLVAP